MFLFEFSLSNIDKIFLAVILGAIVLIFVGAIINTAVTRKRVQADREEFAKREKIASELREQAAVAATAKEQPVVVAKTEVKEETKEPEVVQEPEVSEEILEPMVEVTKEPEVVSEQPVEEKAEPQAVLEEEATEEVSEVVEEEPVVEKVVKPKTTAKKAKAAPKEVAPEPVSTEDATKKRQYAGKYEIFPEDNYYKYQLKASNGEILFVSEMYTTRAGAIKSIDAVKKNIETGTIRIICDKRGMYKFKLIAKNYRVLVIGANYPTEKGAISASESFKRFALTAENVDIDAVSVENMDQTMEVIEFTTKIINKQGGKYEVVKDDSAEYCWYLKASNGEILATGEGFTTKAGCLNGIESFKVNIENGKFYVSKDKNGNYQYKLYTKSGRLSAIGESYKTKTQATNAAKSVRSFSMKSEVVEL